MEASKINQYAWIVIVLIILSCNHIGSDSEENPVIKQEDFIEINQMLKSEHSDSLINGIISKELNELEKGISKAGYSRVFQKNIEGYVEKRVLALLVDSIPEHELKVTYFENENGDIPFRREIYAFNNEKDAGDVHQKANMPRDKRDGPIFLKGPYFLVQLKNTIHLFVFYSASDYTKMVSLKDFIHHEIN